MKSYRTWLSFAFFLNLSTAHAQDSFYEREPMKVRPKRIHLVVQMQGNLTPIATQLNGSSLYSEGIQSLNPGYEITLGTNYNDKWEISAGLRRISLYAGYTFRPFSPSNKDGFITFATFKPYWQLPIQLKVSLWKPLHRFSIWLITGGAVGREDNGIQFSGGNKVTSVIYSANKTPKTLIENTTSANVSDFVSGEIGLSGRWAVSKRIGFDIGVRRYFSQKNLLTFNTKIIDDLGKEDDTNGQSGLNTFNYSASLSIRLSR